jgi:hypothetical protein
MTCQECELVLGGDQRAPEIARHLKLCAPCRALAEEVQANAEAFESMQADPMPKVGVVRVGQPVLPAAIFALAAAFAMVVIAIPREQKLPPVHYALHPMTFEIPPIQPPPPKPAPPREPLMVKMLTDDPNVVIYWQIDSEGDNQ